VRSCHRDSDTMPNGACTDKAELVPAQRNTTDAVFGNGQGTDADCPERHESIDQILRQGLQVQRKHTVDVVALQANNKQSTKLAPMFQVAKQRVIVG
jgi:FtsP/CotA-like multicopper oxidase with cupredoxin domain